MILTDLCKSAADAWTQTPLSRWLASVPIVPVLRNDHWYTVKVSERVVVY